MGHFGRKFLFFLLIGIFCYSSLIFFAQSGTFLGFFDFLPYPYFPVFITLAVANYLLRYVRWHIYLRALGIHLGYWKSFQIFLAGFTMAITPGKAGEALKAGLLKREGNYAWPMGLSVVFAERLMDLIAIVLLAAIGLKILPMTRDIVLSGIILCLLIILVLGQPTFVKIMTHLLGKLPWVRNLSHMLPEIHKNIKKLMTPWLMLVALPISLMAWFAECLILDFALSVCQGSLSLLRSTATYALATLAGTLSIFPGGLVTTEVSMVGLLTFWGLQRGKSVLVTFALRLCTLWFGVFLGMFFLFFLQRKHSHNKRPLLEKQYP